MSLHHHRAYVHNNVQIAVTSQIDMNDILPTIMSMYPLSQMTWQQSLEVCQTNRQVEDQGGFDIR